MKGDKLGIEGGSFRFFRNDQYLVFIIYWVIILSLNKFNDEAVEVYLKFKMGYVFFKILRAIKYDNYLMYENYL